MKLEGSNGGYSLFTKILTCAEKKNNGEVIQESDEWYEGGHKEK